MENFYIALGNSRWTGHSQNLRTPFESLSIMILTTFTLFEVNDREFLASKCPKFHSYGRTSCSQFGFAFQTILFSSFQTPPLLVSLSLSLSSLCPRSKGNFSKIFPGISQHQTGTKSRARRQVSFKDSTIRPNKGGGALWNGELVWKGEGEKKKRLIVPCVRDLNPHRSMIDGRWS